MHRTRPRVDVLALACAAFVAALAVGFALLVRSEFRLALSREAEFRPPPAPPLAVRYRDEVSRLVGLFLRAQAASADPSNPMAGELLGPLIDLRRGLIALSVPSSERDLHLRLVVAVAAWEEGIRAGDSARVTAGSGQFSTLLDEFPWLGKGLVQ